MINIQRPSVRVMGGALVGVMVLGSAIGAEAATKKKGKAPVKVTRTVTLSYTGGCSLDVAGVGASERGSCSTFGAGGWNLPLRPGEKYVTVTVTDSSGRGTSGAFWESGGPGGTSKTTPFCGAIKDYVPQTSTAVLALDAVAAIPSCPGIATQGTVKVAFSNLP